MRTEHTTRPARLLRVRELPGQAPKQPGKRGGGNPKSRFVAPYYLQEEEQEAVATLLEEAQLGDEEGRRLFITAAEYEVAAYRVAPDDEPAQPVVAPAAPKPTSRVDSELAELGRPAEQLIAQLQGTHLGVRKALMERLTESDTFGREHNERYLGQLELELERIAEACRQSEGEVEPQTPPLSANARRLVVQLARIYSECLEVELNHERLDTFGRLLCIIRESAQIAIPCDPEILAGVLQENQ